MGNSKKLKFALRQIWSPLFSFFLAVTFILNSFLPAYTISKNNYNNNVIAQADLPSEDSQLPAPSSQSSNCNAVNLGILDFYKASPQIKFKTNKSLDNLTIVYPANVENCTFTLWNQP